ncbi:MAG: glutamate--cysteine ligase [Bdellovibrionaceae bacterium]|nr:glutamate--cysteine ligase [Pseudobdellovibrionaceae bacterium]
MVQDVIHKQIVRNCEKVGAWFRERRTAVDIPVYSSYDIRDSGFKVVNVDANIYPAGFNNICRTDYDNTGTIMRAYLERHYGGAARKVLVLTEEHTNNPYYWDNVRALRSILKDAGVDVRVAIPRGQAGGSMTMKSASGEDVRAEVASIHEGRISVDGFVPDLVISNNDFSDFYNEWGPTIVSPMNPPRELGWYRRKKSTYFRHYNELSSQFARLLDVDPFLLTVETELFQGFDIGEDGSRDRLAQRIQLMIDRLKGEYAQRGIQEEPVIFVKNNSGTYGLAVIRVESAEEFLALNAKTRKKMKAAKGGRDVEEVILQEGVPSVTKADGGVTAEPAIYMIGCHLAGGFLRTHAEKGPTESLNSPGAVYKRLCVSDLKISVEGHPLENVYGWVAKLGVLAIGFEAQEMNVEFKGYTRWPEGMDPKFACG